MSEVAQLCPTLCNPCSLPGSLVHGIFQARVLESGLPFPSPGDLHYPGVKPSSPTLQATLYPLSHQGSKSINIMHLLCIYSEAKFPSNTSYLVYREDVLFCSSTWAHLICLVGEKKPQFNLEHCIKHYPTPAVMDILCSPIPILSFTALFYAPRVQSCLALWLLLDLENERNQLKMRSVKEIISKILFKSIPSLQD